MATTLVPLPTSNYLVKLTSFRHLLDYSKVAIGILLAPPHMPHQPGRQGTIALYEISMNIFVLITSHHNIPVTDTALLCRCEIIFGTFGKIVLKPEDIASVSTNPELDATVIELTAQCAAFLKQCGFNFLKVTNARLGDPVALLQLYPDGECAFDKGTIHEMNSWRLSCCIACDVGCSGAPLLLWDVQAVGLIRSENFESPQRAQGNVRVATSLPDIVAYHLVSRNSVSQMYVRKFRALCV